MRKCPSMIFIITIICTFLITSCSKDADLLSEYVIQDEQNKSSIQLLVDDNFTTSLNSTIILDVLANDNITNIENVKITSTTKPKFGEIEILEDNTLKFIVPEVIQEEVEEESTDDIITETIVYTTETTNADNVVEADSATAIIKILPEINFTGKTVTELAILADYELYTRNGGEYERVFSFASSGNNADIYPLDAVQALPALFSATGDTKYLNDALELYYSLWQQAKSSNTLIQNCGSCYNDEYLSWHGDGNTSISGYNAGGGPGQFPLNESRSLMHLARILWIMDNSPNLMTQTNTKTGRSYKNEFDYLLNNLEVNFWDKWIARHGASAYTYGGVDQTSGWDFIGIHLYKITNKQKYKDVNDRVWYNVDRPNTLDSKGRQSGTQNGFEELIVPNNSNSDAVQWCGDFACRVYTEYDSGNESISDYGHAGRTVRGFIANQELGMPHYGMELIAKLINTVDVFWPEKFADDGRETYYWMDGRTEKHHQYRNYMPEGWHQLGRFDQNLQNRLENMNSSILAYFTENKTRSVHWGELAFNKAFLTQTIKYPENYYDTP